VAERRRFRAAHASVLEHWVRLLPADSDHLLPTLERWLAVAPFDRQAHERMLQALAARGRLREGDEHLAAAARQYEAEGQDWAPIGHAWRAGKAQPAPPASQGIVIAPLVGMIRDSDVLHGWTHTVVGAVLIGSAVAWAAPLVLRPMVSWIHRKALCRRFRSGCDGLAGCEVEAAQWVPVPFQEVTMSVTVDTLQAFAEAWNRHDLDALMGFMSEDCRFESSAGPDVAGTSYLGKEAVRAGYADVWKTFPDAQWNSPRHFVSGDRGVSEWTFTGRRSDGTRVEVNGCDVFTFRNGKIAVKNSYRKNRPPLAARR
jgi:steroid delta-isomerase-like uncharacterized protein